MIKQSKKLFATLLAVVMFTSVFGQASIGSVRAETEQTTNEQAMDPNLVPSGLSPLEAKVLVIDPGHCKKHPGASGNRLREEVVTLDISKAFRDELENYADITVYMTRDTAACCKALKLGDCLTARSNYARKLSADLLVSVHINAGKSSGANALVAYKSGYHDNIRIETQKFGKIALKNLRALGIKNRGYLLRKSQARQKYPNGKLKDYYAIVRHGVEDQIPAVIMEHGYITSKSDCKKFFKTAKKRKKVGVADAKSVIEYFGLNKKTIAGNFVYESGDTYYKTADGKKLTGWIKAAGLWYYFDEDTGKMHTGWLDQGEESFYLNPNTGEMTVGWFTLDGKKYIAKGNGAIVKSAPHSDGVGSYLFDSNGKKLGKGMRTVGGNLYYVKSSKKLATGWVTYGGNKYYFNTESYAGATGWQKISKKYYYFDPETGVMATNTWIDNYYVNKKGVRTKTKN